MRLPGEPHTTPTPKPGMTIDKATEILSESANLGCTTFNQDFKDAERLGIEALKRVKDIRIGRVTMISIPLPGETKD